MKQRNTPEYQHNTSGISWNNGTLHKEEQLHLNVDYKLKFSEHLEGILKRAGRNINAILITLPYKNFEKRHIFMNCFLHHSWFLLFPFSKDVLQP